MFWKPIHSACAAATNSIRTGIAAALMVTLGLSGSLLSQQPKSLRDSMWKKVDEAIQKGLPKSAIEALGPIEQAALAEKAYPEAIKAIAKRVVLEGQIEGAKPEEHIARMKAEIAKAQPEMLPVMHGIQAQFYWSYFEQNRWRFGQRTATTAPPSDDFTTWDLPRLFTEIDSHYTKALGNEAQLRAIPIATYDILFAKGSVPDSYRPTLFDFIAFSAIHFYTAGEQAGAKAEDAFEIEASSPALGPIADGNYLQSAHFGWRIVSQRLHQFLHVAHALASLHLDVDQILQVASVLNLQLIEPLVHRQPFCLEVRRELAHEQASHCSVLVATILADQISVRFLGSEGEVVRPTLVHQTGDPFETNVDVPLASSAIALGNPSRQIGRNERLDDIRLAR